MTEFWEQWVGSTRDPVEYLQPDATVRAGAPQHTPTVNDDLFGGTTTVATRPGRKLISFPRGAQQAVVDMPENALTKACVEQRHGQCNHRLGAVAEGGVVLSHRPRFVWRCGCACHRSPGQAGMLM